MINDLMKNTSANMCEILLVEDNPGDIRLIEDVIQKENIQNQLVIVNDGIEALKYLKNEPPYEDVMKPGLILLDLNIPKLTGREVVKEIKAKTGLYIRRNLPFLDKVYWGQGGIWSRGYFVSMVGISESTISKYIEMQGKEDSGQALLEF